MPWSREPPLATILTRLLHMQLRAERLLLAQKLRAAEAQARSLSLPTDNLRVARRALATPVRIEKPDALLTLEPAPAPNAGDPLQNIEIKD